MALALSLGARGQGRTWPNPAVGCVVVREGRIVGRGWTQPSGIPHAERVALAQAGELARGATAYVSLEPCAHHGRTSPCAEALVTAGIARLVYAINDPDPRVAGRGAEILREAGVTVESGVLAAAAQRAHLGFLSRIETGRPALTLKLASSFDGKIATAAGESKWITGPAARHAVHAHRARSDAVMVGGGTARADDPLLTVRNLGVTHQPVRIVVSRTLDLPLSGALARTAKEVPLWLCHGAEADAERVKAWSDLGAKLLGLPTAANQISLSALTKALGGKGLTSVYCEGGGALAASLLAADLVDVVIGYTAGLALGADGQPAVGVLGLDRLEYAPRFELAQVRQVGPDIEHTWRRSSP